MNYSNQDGSIRAKIERSSLGSRDARQARSRISDATAAKIVGRAATYPKSLPRKNYGG
jgi:hypothetical protein